MLRLPQSQKLYGICDHDSMIKLVLLVEDSIIRSKAGGLGDYGSRNERAWLGAFTILLKRKYLIIIPTGRIHSEAQTRNGERHWRNRRTFELEIALDEPTKSDYKMAPKNRAALGGWIGGSGGSLDATTQTE